jgi:hypothetical protein
MPSSNKSRLAAPRKSFLGILASVVFLISCAAVSPVSAQMRSDSGLGDQWRVNSIARLMAGLPPMHPAHLDIARTDSWKAHAAAMQAAWKKVNAERISAMAAWRDTAISNGKECPVGKALLYPFAGPDFFNAWWMFPGCETFVMFGLEHIGDVPNIEKMSKRSGAKPVTQYRDEGYLPDAMVNYLARLGWSHGDDEIFSRQQFLDWFDLDHLGRSAAQFDDAKLRWVNAQHLKASDDSQLALWVAEILAKRGVQTDARLAAICGLFKDRCDTLCVLADWAAVFYGDVVPKADEKAQHVTDAVKPALALLVEKLAACEWDKLAIAAVLKEVLAAQGLKMPQLAMPVRVLVMGTAQTPSLDAVLSLCEKQKVLERLKNA